MTHRESVEACPCCGRRTLARRNEYDICRVCWWEDDGQDNADADEVWGGPNYEVSLTQARVNVLLHGIFDPTPGDLRAHQESAGAYDVGRTFVFLAEQSVIAEPATGWESRAFAIER
jgi:hypothetical protein